MSLCFDAVVVFDRAVADEQQNVWVHFDDTRIQGVLFCYDNSALQDSEPRYVNVSLSTPLDLKWQDDFSLKLPRGRNKMGTGTVLNPFADGAKRNKKTKPEAFLAGLNGTKEDMIISLAAKHGSQGILEHDVLQFSRLTAVELGEIVSELEIKGRVRILSFSPLSFLEKASFEFICNKLKAYIEKSHVQNPDKIGLTEKQLHEKFALPQRVMALALKSLQAAGKIKLLSDRYIPGHFQVSILPEEEILLQEMEKLSREGEFRSISLQEFQHKFKLTAAKLDRLLTILTEQKKIVQAQDGFYLHSEWLEGIIAKLRNSGIKELSVGEFKTITGLTRKYAIPLLELLDQMGVTRRHGSTHEIL